MDTRLHQHALPLESNLRTVCIRTGDIRLGIIANHINGLNTSIFSHSCHPSFPPSPPFSINITNSTATTTTTITTTNSTTTSSKAHQRLLRVHKRSLARLPTDPEPQLGPPLRELAPHARERRPERALREPRVPVLRGPLEVGVAEQQLGLAVLLVPAVGEGRVAVLRRPGPAQDAALREQQVGDDLQVEAPVARGGEDEDGGDASRVLVAIISEGEGLLMMMMMMKMKKASTVLLVVGPRHLGERVGVLGADRDVGGRDDAPEAVGAGQVPDLRAVAAQGEDGLVAVPGDEVEVGGVRLHELAGVEGEAEALPEPGHVRLLGVAAAVGQEYEGDLLVLQLPQDRLGPRDRVGALDQDAVDVERECDAGGGGGGGFVGHLCFSFCECWLGFTKRMKDRSTGSSKRFVWGVLVVWHEEVFGKHTPLKYS